MQTINFITGEGYKIDHFPDGERHLVIKDLNRKEKLRVVCRIRCWEELAELMQLRDILERQWMVIDILEIKYLMGMRMDRFMDLNGSITLKIVSDVINSLGANKVEILEPHSDKTLELIRNSCVANSHFHDIYGMVCYPDKGAYKRYNPYNNRALYCSKERDSNGRIQSIRIENKDVFSGGDILVCDDLCDGGGTFIAIAPKLRELNPNKLILYVTHAIQKTGIEKVSEVYDEVYITNSYTDWDNYDLPNNVKVINVL